jgi:hypothetical protein
MTTALLSLRSVHLKGVPARQADVSLDRYFLTLASALAVSGLAELLLQRIVYRVGIHVPRDGFSLEIYTLATHLGDFAFRTTAVLLAVTAVAAVAFFLRRGDRLPAALFAAMIAANLLAWPAAVGGARIAASLVLAFGVAWLAGRRLGWFDGAMSLSLALVAAAGAVVAGQYVAAMGALGTTPPGVGGVLAVSEVALLLTAGLVLLAALPSRSRGAAAAGVLAALLLAAAYAREPATLAIVSMWATGVTMSLPAVLYFAGFGAVVFASAAWVRRPETRHLGAGLALLFVAGLQPQALHHGMTALLALVLLSMGGEAAPAGSEMEVRNAV